MTRTRLQRNALEIATAFLLVMVLAWTTLADAPIPDSASPASTSPGESTAKPGATLAALDLPKLAAMGRFDQILSALRGMSDHSDHRVTALEQSLDLYTKHQAKWDATRLEAYNKSIASMAKQLADGQIEAALSDAIEAHSLAVDPTTMLHDPQTVQLVTTAQELARKAEADGQWIEALSLYRALDLLYDDFATFRGPQRRTERHARLLRLYAPAEFKHQIDARFKRLLAAKTHADKVKDEAKKQAKEEIQDQKPEDEAADADQETWQVRLQGVDISMMRRSIVRAATEHVSNPGYGPLLRGAIDALAILTQTKPLSVSFPSLADQAAVDRMAGGLAALRRDVESQEKTSITQLDTMMTLDRIRELNKKSINLPEQVLFYELTDGAISVLDDYTNVIWPHEIDQFNKTTQGEFYGVGIQISRRDGQLICVSPLEDTPAQKAGIKAGDIISRVDNRDTSSWSLDRAVREITGPLGTQVVLTIQRPGTQGVLEFKLNRAKIAVETIKGWTRKNGGGWDYAIDPIERIGYVRLTQFVPQTAGDLDAAINQLQQGGGVKALILDLRFNPGGLLQSATEVSNRFVADGLLVDTVDKDGQVGEARRAKPQYAYQPAFPVVVLVNQGSASASEIVSGVLQDYARALVVGRRSFGKGSVQDLMRLDGGERAYLKLTTHYYRLPKGRIIHRKPDAATWGIEPDMKVEMTDQQVIDALEFRQKTDVLRTKEELADPRNPVPDQMLENGLDPQLEAALLVLKTRLIAPRVSGATTSVQKAALEPAR